MCGWLRRVAHQGTVRKCVRSGDGEDIVVGVGGVVVVKSYEGGGAYLDIPCNDNRCSERRPSVENGT